MINTFPQHESSIYDVTLFFLPNSLPFNVELLLIFVTSLMSDPLVVFPGALVNFVLTENSVWAFSCFDLSTFLFSFEGMEVTMRSEYRSSFCRQKSIPFVEALALGWFGSDWLLKQKMTLTLFNFGGFKTHLFLLLTRAFKYCNCGEFLK